MIGFLPNFQEEKKLWRKGFKLVIGVDEVGRGSWVGPVVAAAVAWSVNCAGAEVARQRFFRLPILSRRNTGVSPNHIVARKGSTQKSVGLPALIIPRPSSVVQEGLLFSGQPPRALTKFIESMGINDSKALPSQKREQLAEIIKDCSIWAVGEAGVGVINRLGIGKATQVAMRKAVGKVIKILRYKQSLLLRNKDIKKKSPNILISQYPNIFLLVDAFHIKYLKGIGLKNQKAIIKGDQKSISIAAASILAKVYRDNLMRKLAKKYPRYGWARNKGYGTKEHQEAILKYGMTRLHRKQFVKTFLTRSSKESPWRASKVSFRPRSIPF